MRQACVSALFLITFVLVTGLVPAYAERLPLKVYSIEDGLPGAWISHIVQDSRGFLWLSTWDGLSRFDGARFVNYGKDDGLPVQHVNALLETRRGVYWVATNGGGVCRFDPTARVQLTTAAGSRQSAVQPGTAPASLCRVYRTGETVNSNRVNTLYEDRAGRIWAGTDEGLFRLEPEDERASFQRVEAGWSLDVQPGGLKFLEDRAGNLWVATGQGLLRFLPSGITVHYVIAPQTGRDQVYALLEDREERLWIGHVRAGLLVLRPEPISSFASTPRTVTLDLRRQKVVRSTPEVVHLPTASGELGWYTRADGLADDQVSALLERPDGHIWVSAPQGLTAFDGHHFRAYPASVVLGDHVPRQMASDRDGNLWIATSGRGLLKLPRRGLVTYDQVDGVEGKEIRSLYEDEAGAVYAISFPWSINRFDGERFAAVRPTAAGAGVPAYASPAGVLDSTGQWWLLSTLGLLRFPKVSSFQDLRDARPIAVYGHHSGLASDEIYRGFEDARGDLWIATVAGIVNRWVRATGRVESFAVPDADTDRLPTAFGQDRSGTLWIGFADGRVLRLRDGRFIAVTTPSEAAGELVTDFFNDRDGRLWIASGGGGVWRVDDPANHPSAFRAYSVADGLSSNNVRCIVEDAWGRIYLGTSRGVDRLEPESGRLRHYATADGLASDYVTTALGDRRGRLWFGTMAGLSRLDPQIDAPETPPVALITGLRIGGAAHPISELGEPTLSLPTLDPASHQIEIDYAAPMSEMGRVLRFEVTLEGADHSWSAPSLERRRTYARLAAGDYRFLVRAVTESGLTSAAPAAVSFAVSPYWWQRGSVQLAALAVVALSAYGFYRLRVLRLLEAERLRARIATDLHDDVGANLSKIAMLSDTVQREALDLAASPKSRLSSIGVLARESIDGMTDIVWAIDPKRDRFADLAQRIRHFAEELLSAADIDLVADIAAEPSAIPLDAHRKREILLVAKEALTNAAKHSGCSRVDLRLRLDDGWLVLEVEDDGRGLDTHARRSAGGRGLISMLRRAETLGGTLDVIPGCAGGTRVRLRAPTAARRRGDVFARNRSA